MEEVVGKSQHGGDDDVRALADEKGDDDDDEHDGNLLLLVGDDRMDARVRRQVISETLLISCRNCTSYTTQIKSRITS
jgi:hypothetical protein